MPFRERHIGKFKTLAGIKTPKTIRAVGWLLAVFTLAASGFLIFTPWVQTTSGGGVVTALNPNDRLQEINALVPGRIQEWFVQDGSHVSEGDPIVRIIDNDPLLLERLQAERDQVVAKLAAAKSAEETAQIDLDRKSQLFEQGLVARRDFELARIAVEERKSQVAEVLAELTRVDVSLSRQSLQIVRAPRDGVILRVNAGDAATFVNAGDVIATFVPDNAPRAVEIFIDGRDVALVKPGDKVRLQFEGWPVVQFSGWPSIAVGTFGGRVISVDPSADRTGSFRVLVVEDETDPNPWPETRYVRFGAAARGWILLETVSVGYELWRQLNNFPPRFTGAGGPQAPSRGAGAP